MDHSYKHVPSGVGFQVAVGAVGFGVAYTVLRSRSRHVTKLVPGDIRCCVVTGAASGIGKATVLRLEQLGWYVLAADFNEEHLSELNEITSDKVTVMTCDVSDVTACEKLCERVSELTKELGIEGISALANVAGVMQLSPAACVDDAKLRQIVSVNCEAPVRIVRLLMPSLLRSKQARVCIVASITADIAFPWSGCYSATKAFIANFSHSLRREAKANKLPLQVSIVEPGYIDTPMTKKLSEDQIAWCKSHSDDPFAPAMLTKALRNDFIQKNGRLPGKVLGVLGDPSKLMKNPPEDVACDITHAICSSFPLQKYYTMTLMFRLLVSFIMSLPPQLRDLAIVTLL